MLLLAVVALRSIPHYGLFTFVPLWEVSQGASEEWGTRLLSLFLLAGAVGTLIGGPLADRLGRKPVIVGSYVISVPLIVVYVLVGGIPGDVALVLAGAAVIGTFGVTVVLGQEYLPSRIGLASGLSVGLAIGLGGVSRWRSAASQIRSTSRRPCSRPRQGPRSARYSQSSCRGSGRPGW